MLLYYYLKFLIIACSHFAEPVGRTASECCANKLKGTNRYEKRFIWSPRIIAQFKCTESKIQMYKN